MEENQRVKKLINCLKEKKIIHNQNHFVELIGSDKATISLIVNNKEKIPNNLFDKIKNKIPYVNIEWLKTGKCEMLFNQDKIISNNSTGQENFVPLLPISAMAGKLTGFEISIHFIFSFSTNSLYLSVCWILLLCLFANLLVLLLRFFHLYGNILTSLERWEVCNYLFVSLLIPL